MLDTINKPNRKFSYEKNISGFKYKCDNYEEYNLMSADNWLPKKGNDLKNKRNKKN